MRILVTGRTGQVGWELNRCLLPLGEVIAVDYPEFDLSKPEGLRAMVRAARPDVIVNAARSISFWCRVGPNPKRNWQRK